ncbi:MAG: hypothetical protein Q9181_000729 [Wetmoreana brouardii]
MMPTHNKMYAVQQILNMADHDTKESAVIAWEKNEKAQLYNVAVSDLIISQSTLVASVATSSIQWPQASTTHWSVPALWYGALFMNVWCVIIAFHLSILFSAYDTNTDRAARLLDMLSKMPPLPSSSSPPSQTTQPSAQPRKYHMWVLQVPITLFSWGVISYIVGLACSCCGHCGRRSGGGIAGAAPLFPDTVGERSMTLGAVKVRRQRPSLSRPDWAYCITASQNLFDWYEKKASQSEVSYTTYFFDISPWILKVFCRREKCIPECKIVLTPNEEQLFGADVTVRQRVPAESTKRLQARMKEKGNGIVPIEVLDNEPEIPNR